MDGQAVLSGCDLGGGQLLGDIVTHAKIDLFRRLAFERGVRQVRPVLLDVERDQLLHPRQSVERVEVQPLVLDT